MNKLRWELEGVSNLWLKYALRENSNCTEKWFVKTGVGNSFFLSCVHSFCYNRSSAEHERASAILQQLSRKKLFVRAAD